ncbi:hypothetical protein MKX01_029891 [Papaver californicum]|nr:hypothetical protein MKX01_029891 [Papaver californicum]
MRKHRSWSENLCACAGASYVLGGISGALTGLIDGLIFAEAGETTKLKTSRVGIVQGNLGIQGCMLRNYRDSDDVWISVGAGFGASPLYRYDARPRSAAVVRDLGVFDAGFYVVGKGIIGKYVSLEQILTKKSLNG